MKKPKLSTTLNEELKKDSKKERKRRLIVDSILVIVIITIAVMAKMFIFKGNIKINNQETKSPSEKIETQPQVQEEKKDNQPAQTPAPATPAPTPVSQPTQTNSQGYTVYVVKEGDTLSGIANAHGMTSKQLMDYNGMVDPTLMPGQNLKIPN